MPARVLVFCNKPVKPFTEKAMRAALDDADLYTLAEALELPEGEEAAVDAMYEVLKIEATPAFAEIFWHREQRQIQIVHDTDVAGEVAETLENLPTSRSRGAKRVREHLAKTGAIVAFELGISGSLHVAATITEVLAFSFAEEADGLVWFYHREFASPDDRGKTLWKTE